MGGVPQTEEGIVDDNREQHPDPTDEAFARLRAADPAAGTSPDRVALHAAVAGRIADERAGGVGGPAGATTAPGTVTSLDSRRRSRLLQVAAVGVGAALVAGAGGFAIGNSGSDAPVAAGPITLGSSAEMGEMAADSTTADLRFAPGFGSRAVFSASGLSDEGGAARGWAFDAASVFSAETAARLASVLGVAGEPTMQWGAWTVGPEDGSAPNVSVQPDGTASISYYDPTRDPWSCTTSAPDHPGARDSEGATAEPGVEDSGVVVVPEMIEPATIPACDPALGDAPTGDAAVAAMRDVLSSLGVDPDGFEYEVGDSGDARSANVTAFQVLEAQRTGISWNATLVGDGVQSLFGSLAPLVELGDYPVIGAASAVERLNDPRFGAGFGGVMPLMRAGTVDDSAASDGSTPMDMVPTPDWTVPPTVRPGAAVAWPVQQVSIVGARLGLSLVTQADGAAVLVPAYELSDTDGGTWSVVAVADGSLDFAG